MNLKVLHISRSIIKNHFRLLKNWLFYKGNKIVLIFLSIFFLLIIRAFSIYFGEQSSISSQMFSVFFPLLLPVSVASKYLIFMTKEDSLLLAFFNKKNLFASKQALLAIFTISVFIMTLLLGIIPHFGEIRILLIIFIEALLLIIFSFSLPYFTMKINFNFTVSKSNKYWDLRFSNVNFLPFRGVLLREFLSLWRENKKSIFKAFFNAGLINIVLILFIVNNGKPDFFVWAMLLQSIIFLTFITNYSTSNNIKLMEFIPNKEFYILKGEFVFWFILFLAYFTFVVLIYSVLLSQIEFLSIVVSIMLFAFLLLYVLFVRLAYAEEELTRTLIYILMFIPITIPFYFYNSYRRLKC